MKALAFKLALEAWWKAYRTACKVVGRKRGALLQMLGLLAAANRFTDAYALIEKTYMHTQSESILPRSVATHLTRLKDRPEMRGYDQRLAYLRSVAALARTLSDLSGAGADEDGLPFCEWSPAGAVRTLIRALRRFLPKKALHNVWLGAVRLPGVYAELPEWLRCRAVFVEIALSAEQQWARDLNRARAIAMLTGKDQPDCLSCLDVRRLVISKIPSINTQVVHDTQKTASRAAIAILGFWTALARLPPHVLGSSPVLLQNNIQGSIALHDNADFHVNVATFFDASEGKRDAHKYVMDAIRAVVDDPFLREIVNQSRYIDPIHLSWELRLRRHMPALEDAVELHEHQMLCRDVLWRLTLTATWCTRDPISQRLAVWLTVCVQGGCSALQLQPDRTTPWNHEMSEILLAALMHGMRVRRK